PRRRHNRRARRAVPVRSTGRRGRLGNWRRQYDASFLPVQFREVSPARALPRQQAKGASWSSVLPDFGARGTGDDSLRSPVTRGSVGASDDCDMTSRSPVRWPGLAPPTSYLPISPFFLRE